MSANLLNNPGFADGPPAPAGTLTVDSVTIDGAPVDLDGVVADVNIRHGRSGFFDSANPATCQLTLLGVTSAFSRAFRLGARLVVTATDGVQPAPRFTGRFTDAKLDGDVLTAIAVGRYRTLSGYTVGTTDYPEETWSARVTRVFKDAGLVATNLVANPEFDGTAGWGTDAPNTLAAVTAPEPVYRGASAAKVTSAGAAPTIVAQSLAITPGDYTAKIWVWLPSATTAPGGAIQFAVNPYAALRADALPAAVGPDTLAAPAALVDMSKRDQWQELTYPVTVAAGQNWAYLFMYGGITGAIYVDTASTWLASTTDALTLQAGPFNPVLVARPAEPVSLAAYLDELATMVQSAVADLPDGRILVQAIGARSLAGSATLDPDEVGYAPEWTQRLPGANIVTVGYGADLSVTGQDEPSVALYGPISATVETEFKLPADATTALQNRLATDAYGHWNVLDAPLLVGRRFTIGQPLTLGSLPAGAPYDPWTPVLEGWTDFVVSDGHELQWTMELALSDPLLSGLTLPWNLVPPAYLWNTIDQTVQWRDALTLDSL